LCFSQIAVTNLVTACAIRESHDNFLSKMIRRKGPKPHSI
jgi:hypothetical protein